MINGFGCYIKYLAIKSHFVSDKYDYFRYNGMVRADLSSYNKRRDKYFFEKLAKKLKNPDLVEKFFVSVAVQNPNKWIGEFSNQESFEIFEQWTAIIQSISYRLKKDLNYLIDNYSNLKTVLSINNGQYPPLLKLYYSKKIMLETLVTMDMIMGYLSMWDGKISDTVIWPETLKLIDKYQPFYKKYIDPSVPQQYRDEIKNIIKIG